MCKSQKGILPIFYSDTISLICTVFKLCCPAHLIPNTPRRKSKGLQPTTKVLQQKYCEKKEGAQKVEFEQEKSEQEEGDHNNHEQEECEQ